MKNLTAALSLLALGLAFSTAPTFAQRGRGGAPPAGVGSGMSRDNSSSHGQSGNASSQPDAGRRTVSELLTQNTKLASKIQGLTGMDAQQACTGFKNLGQCVAAAHVSKNLGISFACLSSDVTGQAPVKGSTCPANTGTGKMSLGKAIQTLSPGSNSKAEARKASKQAQDDLKETTSS